jgi:glycosyltransferase involved in cell wall biosynthesis
MKRLHLLMVDPIAYAGGSKIATARMLKMLDPKQTRLTILTRVPASWKHIDATILPLSEPGFLSGRDRGVGYFLRHAVIACKLVGARILRGRVDRAIGASGPGVDLSLYLARKLLGYSIIQLVHGPVARSRTIGRALVSADRVFYLESAGEGLLQAMQTVRSQVQSRRIFESQRFQSFTNGLAENHWPTRSRATGGDLFWASSLLKWKGLETLLAALSLLSPDSRPETQICFIRPQDTKLELGPEPTEMQRVNWHENPSQLDQIRAGCEIFVSTSKNEPFGLSILESLAAGLVIIIPRDNAYWDRHLQDRKDCLKYQPGDAEDLALKILSLKQNPDLRRRLGRRGRLLARLYRAEQVYLPILRCLSLPHLDSQPGIPSMTPEADHA